MITYQIASVLFLVYQGTASVVNNVCPTLDDYKTIFSNKNCSYNPDVGVTTKIIVKRYGYHFESYKVTTEDGYILTMHRVGSPDKENETVQKRQPVLVVHGIGGSSAFWVLQGKKSLAFFLVDHGYDVWLGNVRGNYYSQKHVTLPPNSKEYWNFGFHEIALYDLPAMVDFITKTTGQKGNLVYIGHSMGTTISYIYASVNPEHAKDHIETIISLAPVAYMNNVMGGLKLMAPLTPFLANILRVKGFHAIGQFHDLQRSLLGITCGKYPLIISCNLILIFSSGLAINEFQPELLPVFFSYFPAGISLKSLEHYAQLIMTGGRFQMFDYGPQINLKRYNSTVPPEYDVKQISVPVHLFVGEEDIIADPQDVLILESKLYLAKTSARSKKFTLPFAHNDFFLGKHVDDFHKTLLDVIQRR